MDRVLEKVLMRDAARYIWWESPGEAMLHPNRVIAQVMNIGDLEDARELLRLAGRESFRETIMHSEPGWFNPRSWHYWHYALGLCDPSTAVPLMPVRRFQ